CSIERLSRYAIRYQNPVRCARLQRTTKFRVAEACRNDNRPMADSQHSLQLEHPRTFDISRYLSPMAEYNTVFEQHNTWSGPVCCLRATKVGAYWTPPSGALIMGYSLSARGSQCPS